MTKLDPKFLEPTLRCDAENMFLNFSAEPRPEVTFVVSEETCGLHGDSDGPMTVTIEFEGDENSVVWEPWSANED